MMTDDDTYLDDDEEVVGGVVQQAQGQCRVQRVATAGQVAHL